MQKLVDVAVYQMLARKTERMCRNTATNELSSSLEPMQRTTQDQRLTRVSKDMEEN